MCVCVCACACGMFLLNVLCACACASKSNTANQSHQSHQANMGYIQSTHTCMCISCVHCVCVKCMHMHVHCICVLPFCVFISLHGVVHNKHYCKMWKILGHIGDGKKQAQAVMVQGNQLHGVCGAWNTALLSRDIAATAKKPCTCKTEHKSLSWCKNRAGSPRKKSHAREKLATDMHWNSTNLF